MISKKKTTPKKENKGFVNTHPNASKELPKSFYQNEGAKKKKKSEIPDL